jgi:serine/threonine-protein kinase
VQQPTKREGAGASATARFEPVPGMVVAEKYRVDQVLGEGGMGVVVAATHLGLEQPVAIKFLHADAMRDKDSVERFLREAKVAAMVRSDHVARVHDVGSLDGGVPYIVMEHLEGNDLGNLIDLQGPLPIDEACEIALQACAALAEVHAAGIVHRDLKPSNLFVTRRADGSPDLKLLDFGISKIASPMEGGVDPALTATATIMGSPSYMSPEQLRSTKEVDARTDIWSLGAVLYEAVTGKPAFRGENVPQVCAMIAAEDPAAPSSLREGIPAELEQAIMMCLVKKPDERIPLVDLARTLVRMAPERASGLLDRIEATAVPGAVRTREPSRFVADLLKREGTRRNGGPPSSKDALTESTVLKREQRKSRGRKLLVLAALVGAGVVVTGWYNRHMKKGDLGKEMRKEVVGAGSAVASAANVVQEAASAVASVVASSIPDPTALPSAGTAPSASASAAASGAAAEDDEDEEPHRAVPGGAAAAPGGGHGGGGGAPAHPGAKPGAPAKHHTTPNHHHTWHRPHT